MMPNETETDLNASRRRLLGLFGQAIVVGTINTQSGSANAVEQKTASCIVTPQQTEGPFFVDERLLRSDIRSDPETGLVSQGIPLALSLRVIAIGRDKCTPTVGAIVDIWLCDASGKYSDVAAGSFNTIGKKFLRGYQVTSKNGEVRFVTIYPGWYPGRAVHIHFKVRTMDTAGPNVEFTSQWYFDEAISNEALSHPAYRGRAGRGLRNQQDGIFRDGGSQLILAPRKVGDGYVAAFDVGLRRT